ncbi:hypothetical protein TYRP_023786, partial [Tyrophagus putrescentiae]
PTVNIVALLHIMVCTSSSGLWPISRQHVHMFQFVRVVATTGNPRRLVICLNERHHAEVRRTVQPLYRPQKVSPGGQQGELFSLGKRLYGGPFSSRSQRQLASPRTSSTSNAFSRRIRVVVFPLMVFTLRGRDEVIIDQVAEHRSGEAEVLCGCDSARGRPRRKLMCRRTPM